MSCNLLRCRKRFFSYELANIKTIYIDFVPKVHFIAEGNCLILSKESVVMVMDSSPLPGNKQINTIKKIEYVAVTAWVVRLL